MNRSHSDFAQLLSAIHQLNADTDPATLSTRTLGSILSLIPNEMTVFDGFDSDNYYDGYLWYSPPGTVSDEQVQMTPILKLSMTIGLLA